MTLAVPRIARTAWRLMPAPLRVWLRGPTGSQLMRFVPVSIAALAASEITLAVLVGLAGVTAGTAAVIASIGGAVVSYLLSRWAWRRKGKPRVLREVLPFWAVSAGTWLVLGLASHYASVWAKHLNLGHLRQTLFVAAAYFLANCCTFVTRFAIFHYLLFVDRGAAAGLPAGAAGSAAGGPDRSAPVSGAAAGPPAAGDAPPGPRLRR